MEPTSNPDNARSTRGLARFWPVHRDGEDEVATPDSSAMSGTLSGETEMVALGSRRVPEGAAVDGSVSAPPDNGQPYPGQASSPPFTGRAGGSAPFAQPGGPAPLSRPGVAPVGRPGSPAPFGQPGIATPLGRSTVPGPGTNTGTGTGTGAGTPGLMTPFASAAHGTGEPGGHSFDGPKPTGTPGPGTPGPGNSGGLPGPGAQPSTGGGRQADGPASRGGDAPFGGNTPLGGNSPLGGNDPTADAARTTGPRHTSADPASSPPTPVSGPPQPISGPPGSIHDPLNGPISGPPATGPRADDRDRDSDHSRAAAGEREESSPVESGRGNPWDRDFGGFGLGGRNNRFLFGGRNTPEPRPGLNGHGHGETNGRALPDDAAARDENGRDDMNGRAGLPGIPTSDAGPVTPISGAETAESTGRRAAPDDLDARRAAAGWASVPTSTHPVVGPTSAPPTSGAPVSSSPVSSSPVSPSPAFGAASPVSPGPVFGSSYGQPPSYTPALPDPSSGPVSGVPAPRGAASIPMPVAKPQPSDEKAEQKAEQKAETPAGRVNITFGGEPDDEPADLTPAPRRSASLEDAAPVRRTAEEDTVGRQEDTVGRRAAADEDEGLVRRAVLGDATADESEPARRGRRAAPEDEVPEDQPLRPGDVAAGSIAFWDDDAVRHFRAAWHEVKAEFVDDPETALTRAHDLLTDAVNELTEALLAERDELDPLRGNGKPDTESMRMAMRGYREFLDRILAL
ncbi:hypothetical protein KOI35_19675 [Actinoplanes bogorensis]|uniref:Uncharacterized protein n=1 Tax=Paractinoplanes bogorensis TaxID=1610840 RepID=A0ABS5YSM8_9ACTN|nr:hypothetical protein [Actinoplanes bogorensis]MBU2665733.1 hypothetical protein [Actinoplanes bogorensis]